MTDDELLLTGNKQVSNGNCENKIESNKTGKGGCSFIV